MVADFTPQDDDFEPDFQGPAPHPAAGQDKKDSQPYSIDDLDMDPIEVEATSSQLASKPGSKLFIFVILIGISVVFLYNVVFKETPEEIKIKTEEELKNNQPVEAAKKPPELDKDVGGSVGVVTAPELAGANDNIPPPPPSDIEPEPVMPEEPDWVSEAPVAPNFNTAGQPIGTTIILPQSPNQVAVTPQTPAAPLLPGEPAPPAPPGAPALTDPNAPNVTPSAQELAALENARRKKSMVMKSGAGSPASPGYMNGLGDFNSAALLAQTSASTVVATQIGDTDYIIAQGKMMTAVLETAINTDLEGMLRAVVSRDVYAESGRLILIPKGSRLIGSYQTDIGDTQSRVAIVWGRVIRPDGVDIMIDSPGTDQLGRAGLEGFVDRKIFEKISTAILGTIITIGTSIAADTVSPSSGVSTSTTNNAAGGTTTTESGTPTDYAVLSGVQNIGDIMSNTTKKLLDAAPTIIVQQGTRINVFVNNDLHFPPSSVDKVKYVN